MPERYLRSVTARATPQVLSSDPGRRIESAVRRAATGRRLVLAVSGGRDSMVLLHACARVAPRSVQVVATFDHGTGPAASRAATLVAQEGARLGFPVVLGHAATVGASESEWRDARHAFLGDVARRVGGDVTTAHTRDDQLETVVMRILRDSGARGIAGLYATSATVRPLLDAIARRGVSVRAPGRRRDGSTIRRMSRCGTCATASDATCCRPSPSRIRGSTTTSSASLAAPRPGAGGSTRSSRRSRRYRRTARCRSGNTISRPIPGMSWRCSGRRSPRALGSQWTGGEPNAPRRLLMQAVRARGFSCRVDGKSRGPGTPSNCAVGGMLASGAGQPGDHVSSAAADPRLMGRALRRIVYGEADIAERVKELGSQITRTYPEGDLLVLGLLKGSFIFLSDLVRQIGRPLQVDFLVASSYGDATVSSGSVRLVYDPETELEGKHILLVEDIVDSGRTLSRLMDLLQARNPRSLEICALLHKHIATSCKYPTKFVGIRRTERVPGRVRAGSRRELPAPPVHSELAVDASHHMPPKNQADDSSTGGASPRRSRSGSSSCSSRSRSSSCPARERSRRRDQLHAVPTTQLDARTTSQPVTIQAGKHDHGRVQAADERRQTGRSSKFTSQLPGRELRGGDRGADGEGRARSRRRTPRPSIRRGS